MIVPQGTDRLAPTRNMRAKWRTAAVRGVVRDDSQRPAVDQRQRCDHSRPEATAQLEHRALVEQRAQDAPNVVDALALLGDELSQQALVGDRPWDGWTAKVGEVALGRG